MGRIPKVSPEKRAQQALERKARNEAKRLKALRAKQGLVVQVLSWPKDIARTPIRSRERGRFRIKDIDSVMLQLQKSAVRWTDYCTLSWAVHKDAPGQAFDNSFIEPGVTIRFGRHTGTADEIHQRIAVDCFQSPAANLRAAVNGFKALEQLTKARVAHWIDNLSHSMNLYERKSKDVPLEHIGDALKILEIDSIGISKQDLKAQRKRLYFEYHPEIWLDESSKKINAAYEMVLTAKKIRDCRTSELKIQVRDKEKYYRDKHAANLRWKEKTEREIRSGKYRSDFSPFSVVGRRLHDLVD